MKIVAESLQPDTVPYLHVGYLSAASGADTSHSWLTFGGLLFLIIGITISVGGIGRTVRRAVYRPPGSAGGIFLILVGLSSIVVAVVAMLASYIL